MPREVIMPALGMAQETGLLVAWRKQPGEAVEIGDILMEVETDKSTMEVEASESGFLTGVCAREGEDVPVGQMVGFISETAEKAGDPPASTDAKSTPLATAGEASTSPARGEIRPIALAGAKGEAMSAPDMARDPGRILASPKAKRLAAERGIDLGRLAAAGPGQPIHVRDLDRPEARHGPAADGAAAPLGASEAVAASASRVAGPEAPAAETCRIEAAVSAAGFEAFHDWARREASSTLPASDILVPLAASALREAVGGGALVIGLDGVSLPGSRRLFLDPDRAGIGEAAAAETDAPPALVVRDLTASRITGLRLAASDVPVLSVAVRGGEFVLALEFGPGQIAPAAALAVVDGFALRLGEPLRQLL
ncbi:biotin/lipoyl-containing protein [Aurantimonas sp. VKM B-3413]|uniref:biotin/lipoyl-containing protein n=1 Tax=Aurantimonas sp. VKM B-3413 TaxID=2779401 RepID=UPI001E29EB12|nr:biotin/lipoyl-containing protein [Aurantimonas sp. VKM B-3413]MCB8839951.1 E3 binding domain-containing protein [Aurantimonas sp. VKM B-3413]